MCDSRPSRSGFQSEIRHATTEKHPHPNLLPLREKELFKERRFETAVKKVGDLEIAAPWQSHLSLFSPIWERRTRSA